MKQLLIILLLFFVSTYSFGCSCGHSVSSYFLNQVKYFDAIVEGNFYRDRSSGRGYIIIDKIYKGNFSNDTIQIAEGGTDCTEAFMEDVGKKIILGLRKSEYKSSPNAYSAPSCVTSVLLVEENKIYSKTNLYNLQISNPKIGLVSTQMGKDKFTKKIKRLATNS